MKLGILSNSGNLPRVLFKSSAYSDLKHMLSTKFASQKEFMFIGEIKREGLDFIIEKLLIAPQEKNSGTFVETDDDRYPGWLAENYHPKDRKKVRLHGHSHVNMGVTPSGVDDNMISRMMSYVSDYYIQLIVNLREDFTINLFDKTSNIIYYEIEPLIILENGLVSNRKLKNYDLTTKNIKVIDEKTLSVDDTIFLDLKTLTFYIKDSFLKISQKEISVIMDEKKIEDYEKKINEMVKPEPVTVKTPSIKGTDTGYNLFNRYDYDDYDYAYRRYSKPSEKTQVKEKKRCKVCSLTTKEGCKKIGCGQYGS